MSLTQLNLAKVYHAAEVQALCGGITVAPALGSDTPFDLNPASGLAILNDQYSHESGGFNAPAIAKMIDGASVTMASLLYVTYPPLAAKHKGTGNSVAKVTRASVQLFGTITDRALYSKQVLRAAGKLDDSQELPAEWLTSPNWFHHSAECYSVVKHNTTLLPYLYAIYNTTGTHSECYLYDTIANGGGGFYKPSTPAECAEYMTPSAARDFLKEDSTTHNATNGVDHNLVLRVLKLGGVVSIKAKGLQASITRD